MQKELQVVGQIEHAATGITVEVVEQAGKRPSYLASVFGFDFKVTKREKLEAQVRAQLDLIAAQNWIAVIEAYTRYAADGAIAYLSFDRYWLLQLPASDLIRANWREDEDDDARARFARSYMASVPPGFSEPLPFIERTPERQRVWMPYAEPSWNGWKRSLDKLRAQAAGVEAAAGQVRPTAFTPPRVARYEMQVAQLERLISDYLEIDYAILTGERWSPEGGNALNINLDGYDDGDRSIIEQIRSGERCYFALEVLMRVLVEKHVLPEGDYLITAAQ